nr:maltose ABC transporter permease MalF [Anaerolineae bacterium]
MGVSQETLRTKGSSTPAFFGSLSSLPLRLLILVAIDAGAIWFGLQQVRNGAYVLVIALGIVTLMANVIILLRDTYPLRWMLPGLVLMALFSIYPNLYTIYIGFTNYGDGHLLSKPQAIERIQSELYLPEGGSAYSWTAYKSDDGDYALWLVDADGLGYLATVGEPLIDQPQAGEHGIVDFDANGIPTGIEGYTKLNPILATTDQNLPNIKFGVEGETIQIRSTSDAAQLVPRYTYDPEANAFTDNLTGRVFEDIQGTYTSMDGQTIIPGYSAWIGLQNFKNFFTSPAVRGPLFRILIWNFIFPILSVLTTFGLGLLIALFYNDPNFKGKKLVRSFLIVPYTIPSLITILIWKGMLNPEVGVVNDILDGLIGISPSWTTVPMLARIALVIVNLWLGYPYFMLVCSGALQSIPSDIYEAAEVDGANAWQRFRKITLPLLLVAVGPLLIASYTFNFNNFNLIYLFIGGGPPIAGASIRAGHTDILISFVYNMAFEGGRGQNFGFAAAITLVIFVIVAVLTLFQFRYTNMWEEVSENV